MNFLETVLKIIVMLAAVLLVAAPFALEFLSFRRDMDKKISYKRFRVLVYTLVYIVAVTVALYLLKELLLKLEGLGLILRIVARFTVGTRIVYCTKVLVALLINFAIGVLYRFFGRFVRIGLKRKTLTVPQKKDGGFNWRQKLERRIIRFFHTETWFFVGRILKYFTALLSAAYGLIFILYLLPAMFDAAWIPYGFISTLFSAGYLYPTITLLGLWELYFFLRGIERVEEECPELLQEEDAQARSIAVDLAAIDEAVRKRFRDFYACDVDLSESIQEKLTTASHHPITEYIAQAVENDERNPQPRKEAYLDCVDKLVEEKKGILISGGYFSGFSAYFLRYLSAVIARGDNVVFVCNSDAQIDAVYDYTKQGLAEISSLFCKGFQNGAVDFDDPIWRIVKISGERAAVEDSQVDENNILVTSLSYLCSARFASTHSRFISQIDAVVFVDTLCTVNTFHRQLAILNTRLKHIIRENALSAQNGGQREMFRVRYISRQLRYICFDDSRVPGLDKILKNMLGVDFTSADAMYYDPKLLVRCYNWEGRPDEQGRVAHPHFIRAKESLGAVMNMALLCLAKGAGRVSVFADDMIPYENIRESMDANKGQISIQVNEAHILLNKRIYGSNGYSVIIAVDSGDNLPAALRRYAAMVSDQPVLLIIFSRPYMLRSYYIQQIEKIWSSQQLEQIPVEEGTEKDIAQRILVSANAGGISKAEILRLASGVPPFDGYAKKQDINGILRCVLQIYGVCREDQNDLFRYFEYQTAQVFDTNGKYSAQTRIVLRRQGRLFEQLNGRDMVTMKVGDNETVLPLPKSRLTQNYIAGQNLVHNGCIYHIDKIHAEAGSLYARLAVAGKNEESYRYVQDRYYRVEPEQKQVLSTKHVRMQRSDGDVSVSDAFVSVFRAPAEVVTKGYFPVDPHTLDTHAGLAEYHCISDPGNDDLAKQTYRRYGTLSKPSYSPDEILKKTDLVADSKGMLMMSVRLCGTFGSDLDKTVLLAAVMLSQVLRAMFPSVADAVAVCPVLRGSMVDADEEAKTILQRHPKLTLLGQQQSDVKADFELLILEDCATDLGVVSVLMSSGDDVLRTLFAPICDYLRWYLEKPDRDDYLRFGLDHTPGCFDFDALQRLSGLLGDKKNDLQFVDMEDILEYEVCDFCGRRYAKGDGVLELDDGRKMCKACAENLVGNNKKLLKAHLDRARIFLESSYGITLEDDYDFCFESTVKLVNTLKQNRSLVRRGSDVPLRSYLEGKKVHAEYSVPSVSLSELLVRELTHVWQRKHLSELDETLAEGQIALVAVQYLRFLKQNTLVAVRTGYYETNGNLSGVGYRKLVRGLLENPQFNNNPFLYLLEFSGVSQEGVILPPPPGIAQTGNYGLPYTPAQPDRVLNGKPSYFYYENLTATKQRAYDSLLQAVQTHAETVQVEGCSLADMQQVSDALAFDHPELFWYKNFSMDGTVHYGASAEECALLQKRIDAAVAKYLEGITDAMSAYDVAVRIHAKLIASVDYDTIALNRQKQAGGPEPDKIDYLRTVCGVFLDGKAVCEGYARALQYLLQKCGIECAEVAGYIRKETGEADGAHAWNIVKIDGDYYYMDTTWDDSSNTVQSVKNTDLGFDYFCITTEELLRTRDVSLCPVEAPVCTAVNANFFHHNDLVLDSYDPDEICRIAVAAAEAKQPAFTFKCKSKAVYETVLDTMFARGEDCADILKAAARKNKQILTNSYSYTYNRQIWTVTIKFKLK